MLLTLGLIWQGTVLQAPLQMIGGFPIAIAVLNKLTHALQESLLNTFSWWNGPVSLLQFLAACMKHLTSDAAVTLP